MASLPIQCLGYTPPPTPPAPAQAVGFTKLLRRNFFTSTSSIDLSNTGVDGFQWYTRFAWPNVAANNTGEVGNWSVFAPNSSGNYSISGNTLVIASGAATSNLALASACYSATDMRGYVGTLLPRSFYAESTHVYSGGYSFGAAAFWSMPLRFLNGTATPTWIEQDWTETGNLGSCVGNCVHQGALTWTTATGNANSGPLAQDTPNPVGSTPQTYGALCMSPSDNAGHSHYQVFYNNVAADISYADLDIEDTDQWIIYYSGGQTITSCDFWVPP
jgi:hypothetical protein